MYTHFFNIINWEGRFYLMKYMRLFIFSLIIVIFAGCNAYKEIKPTHSEKVDQFTFTTQDEETLSLEDLEGKWWIADFVFTNCTSTCMPMTFHMSLLQDQLKEEDLEIELISF